MFYRFRHRIVGPLAIAWLLFAAASLVERIVSWNRLSQNLNASAEATRLGEALDQLFLTLQGAETAQRGYLLTGNEDYLPPFNQSKASLAKNFNKFAEIAMTDRLLESDLLQLRGLAELKMSEMKDLIKVRQEKGLSAAAAQVNSGKGRELMDQINKVVGRMRAQKVDIFSTAAEATREHLQAAQILDTVTGFLIIGAAIFTLYLVRVGYLQEKARRELVEEKRTVEKVVVEKSAFLANMSHEIRTPMNAILGFGELLEGEALTGRQAQYVRSIRQSGKSLLQLINDVLDLSKLEAGRLELCLEPTDVREACDFLRTMFAQQALAKSLDLQFEIVSAPRALLLDRLRLRQVLVNIVGNALKFTDRGFVKMRVRWVPDADDVSRGTLLFDVVDTGIGISPEKREEIFLPFVQSDPRRNTENPGTGLGLNIVQRLMGLMDGTVTLESEPGKGSVFHLRLAGVSVSARLPVSDLATAEAAVDFNDFVSSRLLVVDDNEINCNLIAGMFAKTHHQVRMARNGREALKSIAKNRPDLVLLDLRMPVMDGLATLAEIRKQPELELLPVIAVTASSQPDGEADMRRRFNGYIQKPFTQRVLYQELAQFLPRASVEKPLIGGNQENTALTASIPTARKANDWEGLTTQLRVLQAGDWTMIRESLAINDTQAFARKLRSLGAQAHCNPLTVYAEKLAAHAEAYAVHDLETQLSEFPTLVKTIQLAGTT